MEKSKYNSYNNSSLRSAESLQIQKSIYIIDNIDKEIESILNTDYEKDLISLKEEEKNLFQELKEKTKNWDQIAFKIKVIQESKKYNELCNFVKNLKTTDNKYIKDNGTFNFKEEVISNKLYNLYFRVYKNTSYRNKEEHFLNYEVSYNLFINEFKHSDQPVKTTKSIKSIDRKKFLTEEEVKKYIEGRKKFFEGYFKEEYPPVGTYLNSVSFRGKMIKGFRI